MNFQDIIKNLERESNSLLLRPYQKEDYPNWYELQKSNTQLLLTMDEAEKEVFLSQKNFTQEINSRKERSRKGEVFCIACFQKSNNELLCEIWIKNIFRENYNYCLIEMESFNKKWGQLYSLEALSNIFEICFVDLDLNRLEMLYDKQSASHRDVLARLAMRSEGIRKQGILESDRYKDVEVYALTKEEWKVKGVKNLKNISLNP